MAIVVKMDQIEGAAARRTLEGWEAQRVAYVSGLTGNFHQRMAQAIGAEGIPSLRQAHPSMTGIFVTTIDAQPAGVDGAMVRITYSSSNGQQLPAPGEPAQIEVGATLCQTTTTQDIAGNPLTVTLGDDEDAPTQIARVTRLAPQVTVRYSRLETSSPGSKARTFVGRINSTEVFGSEEGTWMCTAITGRSHDGGETYEVSYDFQYNPDGWQPAVVYLDPATGRPHPDAEPVVASIYEAVDFTDLEL
jgi:hypothetical protein